MTDPRDALKYAQGRLRIARHNGDMNAVKVWQSEVYRLRNKIHNCIMQALKAKEQNKERKEFKRKVNCGDDFLRKIKG